MGSFLGVEAGELAVVEILGDSRRRRDQLGGEVFVDECPFDGSWAVVVSGFGQRCSGFTDEFPGEWYEGCAGLLIGVREELRRS